MSRRGSASLSSERDGIPSRIAIREKIQSLLDPVFGGVSLFLANSSRIESFMEMLLSYIILN